jgi:outer membrane protein assembly factor BamB
MFRVVWFLLQGSFLMVWLVGCGGTPTPATIQWSPASYESAEVKTLTLTATRLGGADRKVSVDYATADGTAKAGEHYTQATGKLTWEKDDLTPKTVEVALLKLPESGEASFEVVLSGLVGEATTLAMAKATITLKAGGGGGVVAGVIALTAKNELISFAAEKPKEIVTRQAVTGLQEGESLLGIDIRPATGVLYGLGSSGRLYTLDASTGKATQAAVLSADASDTTEPFTKIEGTFVGMDFNPVPDRLRVVTDTGQNLRINVETGATITDGTLKPMSPKISAAAYTNSFAGAGTTALYVIDHERAKLFLQNPPNDGVLVEIGDLGVSPSGVSGFDILGKNGQAWAILEVGAKSALYEIDLTTGKATRVEDVGDGSAIRGLALPTPKMAVVFGILDQATQSLIRFSPTKPEEVQNLGEIKGLQAGESLVGLDVRPATGKLYGVGSSGRLYIIDPDKAEAQEVATLSAAADDMTEPFTALMGTTFGVDFNPVPDRLRVVTESTLNLRINVETGATITDGALKRGAFSVTAAAYTNSFAGTTATSLFVLDSASGRLLLQSPPNDGVLRDVGSLGMMGGVYHSFDIVSESLALALWSEKDGAVIRLLEVDTKTGKATDLGELGSLQTVEGMALPISKDAPAADSMVYILSGGGLHSFARNAPQTLQKVGDISGLAANEKLVGMDFRPATGELYALGDQGNLYTLDLTDASATMVASLKDDQGAAIALRGQRFGVDFNPVPDRLRVVSDEGQNLRINVETGVTITDGDLKRIAPMPIAAAYTNSYAGAKTTQLFVLDAEEKTLMFQNPPNDGVLSVIGSLKAALVGKSAGFDIAGGHNGFALAAFATEEKADQSKLFRINLTTGEATLIGAINAPSPLRSMAIWLD